MRTAVIAPQLDPLLALLHARGYRTVGPRVRDGAIVYADLERTDELPRGWTDVQEPGSSRLERRDDGALFGFAVGPSSWKRELFPPRHRLWEAVSDGDATFRVVEPPAPDQPMAFLGVRPCELAAIGVQDRVFLHGPAEDRVYAGNRRDLVLIAVECMRPSSACFCTSMGTGPGLAVDGDGGVHADTAGRGSEVAATAPRPATPDLVLTELLEGDHRLLVRAITGTGEGLLAALEAEVDTALREPTATDLAAREATVAAAAATVERRLPLDEVHDLLLGNLAHPRWDDVAARCLTCTNCTMVCPTCFCNTVEDTTDLTGEHAFRDRRWDSCFTLEFTHTGPAPVRGSARSRYRQWLTHKLATWVDQFGTSGCVGCGRCITWCPVGIDITEEVAAIGATDGREVAS